ncbi:MAG: hypothetical protein OHK0029_21510 [Armatimonadaceae bacterium]
MKPINTLKLIEELEALVETERMKFMGFVRLDEEQFLDLTGRLRASLPDEIQRANRLTENSDRLMESAQQEASRVIMEARAEAKRLLEEAHQQAEQARQDADSAATKARENAAQQVAAMTEQSEINRIATVQAREIVAQAETEARTLRERAEADAEATRHGADEYARQLLETLERTIRESLDGIEQKASAMLTQVQRGRAMLDSGNSGKENAENTVEMPARQTPPIRPANMATSGLVERRPGNGSHGLR